MILLLLFSFFAGVITVLSPCILPILPLLLAVGINNDRYKPLGIITGLICSFTFFTLSLSVLIQATGISPDFLRYGAIAIIIFAGLTLLFPSLDALVASITSRVARIGSFMQAKSTRVSNGYLSGFVLGVALGLVWTPCAGPILAAVITLIASHTITVTTVLAVFVYSIGAAIPMFLIGYMGNKIFSSLPLVGYYSGIMRKVFGVVMILSAIALIFHFDEVLQKHTLDYFPTISVEDNPLVKKELEKIMNMQNGFLQNGSKAPELTGIVAWINSAPLTLEQLHGKVVLVDFWTYSCINCVRTLPHLKKWYEMYKDKGFVLIGVHTPEFAFEKTVSNVQDAVKRFGIEYPVALDSDYATWKAYNNRYWPAHYLVDRNGIIQEHHFGEGGYQETENAIRKLLELSPMEEKIELKEAKVLTPELYLGYARASHYQPEVVLKHNQATTYEYKGALGNNEIGLQGLWFAGAEFIQAESNESILTMNFLANRVYLVMQASTAGTVQILLDNEPLPARYYTPDTREQGVITIQEPRMYDLVDLKGDYGRHTLTLHFSQGISAYAFTFGGGTE